MATIEIDITTDSERFYNITNLIEAQLPQLLSKSSGVLHIFNPHTSCGLLISESFDATAATDLEQFLKHLAPYNLPFISHTAEGKDDSPSHMKNLLLSPTLTIFVENNRLQLGTWQGIYLCEFRHHPQRRRLWLKFIAD